MFDLSEFTEVLCASAGSAETEAIHHSDVHVHVH